MSENRCIAWFDCGTTNTRLYLIAEDGTYRFCGGKAVGSRNVAMEGSCAILAQAMAQLLQESPESAVQIYASGMVTSAFGLKEVPHLVAPVSAAAPPWPQAHRPSRLTKTKSMQNNFFILFTPLRFIKPL